MSIQKQQTSTMMKHQTPPIAIDVPPAAAYPITVQPFDIFILISMLMPKQSVQHNPPPASQFESAFCASPFWIFDCSLCVRRRVADLSVSQLHDD